MSITLILIVAGTIGKTSYDNTRSLLYNKEITNLIRESEIKGNRLDILLGESKKDTVFLANMRAIKNIFRSKNIRDNAPDSTLISQMLNIKSEYTTIRLFPASDYLSPLISVHKKNNKVFFDFNANGNGVDYTDIVNNFKPGIVHQVYLSDIAITHEGRTLNDPFRFEIKAVSPIYDNNKLLGALELTINVSDLLLSLDDSVKIEGHSDYIVNSKGYYLQNENRSMIFDKKNKHNEQVQKIFVELAPMFDANIERKMMTVKSEKQARYIHFHKVKLDEANTGRFIGLVETQSDTGIYHRVSSVINEIILLTLVLVIIGSLLASIFSRLITKPLKELIDATAVVASGNLDVSIPVNSNDEIGLLASSFNSMVKKLTTIISEKDKLVLAYDKKSRDSIYLQLALNEHAIVSITDKAGKIFYLNTKLTEVSQYTREEIIGKNHNILNSGRHSEEFWEQMWNTIIVGKPWHGEICNKKKNGELYWVDTTIMPFLDENGTPYQYVAIRRDITNIKNNEKMMLEAQNELHHAQKMKAVGTLAGGIAHDFNNILMAILNYAELVQMDTDEKSELHENITEVIKGCGRAQQLIEQILNFSRKKPKQRELFQPQEVINEVLKLIRATIPSSIRINTQLNSEDYIKMDPLQFHQIILNICLNAKHAIGRKPGEIDISLRTLKVTKKLPMYEGKLQPGKYTLLSIGDNGCGIPEMVYPNIFTPFFTTRAVGEGTGLGLAEVYGIIMEDGGGIFVDTDLGIGTRFDIYIPVAETKSEIIVEKMQQYATRS